MHNKQQVVAAVRRGYVHLNKMYFMPVRLFIVLVIILSSKFCQSQHPWQNTLRSTAQDLVYTLQLQPTDSICINTLQTQGVSDSLASQVAEHFSTMIEERISKAIIQDNCRMAGYQTFVSGYLQGEEDVMQLSLDGGSMSSQRDWSAVFYLPMRVDLPARNDSVDAFNKRFFIAPALPAKATLVRMSGQEITGTLVSSDGIDIVIDVERRKGKMRRLNIHKSEVFSITFPEGEWVLYAPDEVLGDDLTVDEMRIFIAGEQDARKGFKTWPTFTAGVVLGLAGAVFAEGGLIITILPPVAYTLLQLAPVIKIQGASISNPDYLDNDIYAMGYERVARPKKLIAGLKGSALGMGLGIITYFITR